MVFIFPAGSIKRLVYLISVMCAAGIIYSFFANSQSHWIIWSALSLSLITLGKTFKRRLLSICLTGVLIAITVFIVEYAAVNPFLLAMYLFLIITGGLYLAQRYPEIFYLSFVVNLCVVVACMQVFFTDAGADRLMFILIGTLIAVLLQVIFCLHYKRDRLRSCFMMVLRDLNRMNNEIFSCFLQPAYSDNVYLYERRLHIQKNKLMRSMRLLTETIQFYEKDLSQNKEDLIVAVAAKLNMIYNILLDCALLRIRVVDYTVFSVCADELNAIMNALNHVYLEMIHIVNGKKYHINLIELSAKIQQFEDNYQSVLQVTAKEPLVFLLFISSLKSLYEEIASTYELMLKLKYLAVKKE